MIEGWRRGWDSNPRAGYPTRRFRGVPVTTTSVPLRVVRMASGGPAIIAIASVPGFPISHRYDFAGGTYPDSPDCPEAGVGAKCANDWWRECPSGQGQRGISKGVASMRMRIILLL